MMDVKHAQRLQGPNTVFLKTFFSNHFAAPMLRKMGLLKAVMLGTANGTMTPEQYYPMVRARRELPWYMRGIEERGAETHPKLCAQARQRFRTLRRQSKAAG